SARCGGAWTRPARARPGRTRRASRNCSRTRLASGHSSRRWSAARPTVARPRTPARSRTWSRRRWPCACRTCSDSASATANPSSNCAAAARALRRGASARLRSGALARRRRAWSRTLLESASRPRIAWPASQWWPRRPLATLGRKPRQGRKAATVSIDAGAEASWRGHRHVWPWLLLVRMGGQVLAHGDGGRPRRSGGPGRGCATVPPAARVVEPPLGVLTATSLRQIRKTPLAGRFAYLAERGGFEPPKRCLGAYTLSRRAPSTTRTPLREARRAAFRPRAGGRKF